MAATAPAARPTDPAAAPDAAARAAGVPAVPAWRRDARAVRAEWVKLRTLRSTWITVGLLALVMVGFGVLAALMSSGQVTVGDGGGPPRATDPLSTVLTGADFGVIVVAVLGAVIGAREYGSGMVRTSLAAVPTRLPWLWGKVASFVAVLLPVAVLGVLGAFAAGMGVLGAAGHATVAFGDAGVARVLFGTAGYLVALGLIGLALGVLVRSTAGAIGTVVGAVLFVPTLATALLPDSWGAALKYLPSNAATALTALHPSGDTLSPAAGGVVLAAWVVLAVAGAALALARRDV